MKKSGKDCLPNAVRAAQPYRYVSNIVENAVTQWHKVTFILVIVILFFSSCASPRVPSPPPSPQPEETLNLYIYRFIDQPDDIFFELLPGDRFRLPLIRGYRVRVDYNKIEIIALTDREVVEPEGQILPSGHVSQLYNLGRLPPIEYELLISFDHQTDRYFLSVDRDRITVRPFRDEFSKVIIP